MQRRLQDFPRGRRGWPCYFGKITKKTVNVRNMPHAIVRDADLEMPFTNLTNHIHTRRVTAALLRNLQTVIFAKVQVSQSAKVEQTQGSFTTFY